jgi:hypothetical protein
VQPDKESWEVIAAAQHYVKTGDRSRLNTYRLKALKKLIIKLVPRTLMRGGEEQFEI